MHLFFKNEKDFKNACKLVQKQICQTSLEMWWWEIIIVISNTALIEIVSLNCMKNNYIFKFEFILDFLITKYESQSVSISAMKIWCVQVTTAMHKHIDWFVKMKICFYSFKSYTILFQNRLFLNLICVSSTQQKISIFVMINESKLMSAIIQMLN